MRLTLNEIADRLAGSDSDDAARAFRRNQLRHFQRAGVLPPAGPAEDARGTVRYDTAGYFRAAIFVALADLAVSSAGVAAIIQGAEARSALEVLPREAGTADAPFVWRGLASIVDAVAAGERWELRIDLGSDDLPYARFVNLDWAEDPVSATKPRARIAVDLNALWAALPSLEG